MVVSSMTACEMYDDLAADNGKIEIKRQQLEYKAVKKFKKPPNFRCRKYVLLTVSELRFLDTNRERELRYYANFANFEPPCCPGN